MPELFAACLALGAVAGILAGLLGVGGGLVIVPALLLIFSFTAIPEAVQAHLAVGTSLATIVATSIASVRAHHRRGAVRWEVFAGLTPGILLGALSGGLLAGWLAGGTLRVLYGLFALVVALLMALDLRPKPQRRLPGPWGLGVTGAGIGLVSALVGIGGGTMTVPFLTWCNLGVRSAVATSAACGLPIAVAGAAGFLWSGWGDSRLPPYSSGYLYWPAFAGIVLTSTISAGMGARLAHSLPASLLKRGFAIFLFCVGVYLVT